MSHAQSPLVFVVDDDPGLLRLINKTLTRAGYEVASAGSGKAAIEWLKGHEPDLLLLDLKLKDISGADLIDRLVSQKKSLRFVIITGQGDERAAVEMMKRGALDYLVKDASFLEFLPTMVERALQQVEREKKLSTAEEALRKEHDFVSALLRICGALVVVLDRDGRIVRFNSACERATGFSFEELKGKLLWQYLILPEEAEAVRKIFDRLRDGELHNQYENVWLTKDGQRRDIAWSNAVLSGDDGKVEYIIGTGIDITDRKQLENEILKISELEQQRIGRDLHDGICQHLAGIEFMSQVLEQRLAGKAKAESTHASEIARLVRQAISDTRNLAHGLSPVFVGGEGLMVALEEMASSMQTVFRVQCRFLCPEPVLVEDNTVATHLFRIAQEAASNAIRHGKATEIEIALTKSPERVNLLVRDNGAGFPRKLPKHRGMGLRIMQYRAGMIGGSLVVQKNSGKGTTIVCTVHLGQKPQQATGKS